MIEYYCDRCGRFIPQPKHKEVNICIRGILTVDLCDRCVEDYDKMTLNFVKGCKENKNCLGCKHWDKPLTEEPCKGCVECETEAHINFERRD